MGQHELDNGALVLAWRFDLHVAQISFLVGVIVIRVFEEERSDIATPSVRCRSRKKYLNHLRLHLVLLLVVQRAQSDETPAPDEAGYRS